MTIALQVTPAAAAGSFISRFSEISDIGTTVPSNGDVNPYGLAVVPRSSGDLVGGDILVSNFNAASNLQGTGTTVVQLSPTGRRSLFADVDPTMLHGRCPGGVGLTTALSILPHGFVVVGSLPTEDGTPATARAGCLIVLDDRGRVVETISGGGINGPWDMTAAATQEGAALFVTNVLNGTVAAGGAVVDRGTVLRLDLRIGGGEAPAVVSRTVIASGFSERTDPSALVIGPTGVALGLNGTLYVADSLNNRIAAIPRALTRQSSALSGLDVTANGAISDPLGLTVAPNGDILTVNGANGKLVETTPAGAQIAVRLLDRTGTPPGVGTLFGLALAPRGRGGVLRGRRHQPAATPALIRAPMIAPGTCPRRTGVRTGGKRARPGGATGSRPRRSTPTPRRTWWGRRPRCGSRSRR